MDDLVPIPSRGRTVAESRRVRSTDTDPRGRLRLDAVARFLQEIAIDDVDETGWGARPHLVRAPDAHRRAGAFPRRSRSRARHLVQRGGDHRSRPALVADRRPRRPHRGRQRLGHLDADQRPARITDFEAYAEAAAGRRVSSRPTLVDPPADGPRSPWPLRASDVDLHGHVNNTVYWQAIEHVLVGSGPELRSPLRVRVEFREPLDLGDPLGLAVTGDERRLEIGFLAGGRTTAVATIDGEVGLSGVHGRD